MSSAIESGAATSTGAREPQLLRNYVGGRWTPSRATEFLDVHNPATGATIARTPLSTAADVDAAVEAARRAFPAWRDTPLVVRARALFRFRSLLEEHFEELARIVTTEHGKTLDESRGSVRRGIENVEVACGVPVADDGLRPRGDRRPASTARSSASRWASSRRSRRSTSRRWCRSGSCRSRSRPATRSSSSRREQVPLSQQRIFELLAAAATCRRAS